jgi:putative DNA primase/helicase
MNIELEFRNAMAAAGIETDAPIFADGNLHRVHVEGDKPGTKNGWYVLHACSFPAGAFGCNKRGISDKWRSQTGVPFTPSQRADVQQQSAKRNAERDEAYAKAALRAAKLVKSANKDATGHAYCARKQIEPFGVKANSEGLLVIPIYDARDGLLQSLQTIAPDGTKRMLAGGRLAYGLYPLAATRTRMQSSAR